MAPTDVGFAALLALSAFGGFIVGVAAAVAVWWVLSCVTESISAWLDHDEGGNQ